MQHLGSTTYYYDNRQRATLFFMSIHLINVVLLVRDLLHLALLFTVVSETSALTY